MDPVALLTAAYRPLIALTDDLAESGDEARGWQATRLPGWTVRDVVFHLASDCQRALVALHTPVDGPTDTDEISYWSHWQPGTEGAQAGLRGTRIIASAWSSVRAPAALHVETARAVLRAAAEADVDRPVATQGYRLTVGSLLHTLAVEATVHHLDLGTVVDDEPSPEGLAAVRHVLDGLLRAPVPAEWDDRRYAELGTGRAALTSDEREELGPLTDRFPLFG